MALAIAFTLAPLALALDQGLTYVLVKWVCATGATRVLVLIPVMTLGMTVTGAVVGWSAMLAQRTRGPRYLVALLAVSLNVLFGLLILTAIAPRQLLSPCE